MRRLLLLASTLAALAGCATDATPAAAITPEPAASPPRSTTTVEGSAELARPAVPTSTPPGAQAAQSATPAAASSDAVSRSIPLAITGMT